jgi:Fur family peroxide stress response transcriptional regulator
MNGKVDKLKMTPQRMAIMEYLDGNTSHPSADDIFKAVSGRFPTMSFATVYNTLDALKARGRVLELTIDPERKRYDPNTMSHHHLICITCKKVADIHRDYDIPVDKSITSGYEIIGKHIEFYGLCPMCQKQ